MKTIGIEIKWAVRFVMMMLLWVTFERMVGLHDQYIDKHAVFTNFMAIPAIIIYVYALIDKRDNFYGGVMDYKRGVISGLIITLIVTLFTPLTQYLVSTFITPAFFSNAVQQAVKSNAMTQEQAEAYFNMKSYIVQGFIGAPIMGLITTVVVAIFTRKRNTEQPVA